MNSNALEVYLKNLKVISAYKKDCLVSDNLKLVVHIARQYHHYNKNIDLCELISCGNIGLMEAAKRFKPELGFKFSTYATDYIRFNISDFIYKFDVVHPPVGLLKSRKEGKCTIDTDDFILNNIQYSNEFDSNKTDSNINKILNALNAFERSIIIFLFGINIQKKIHEELYERYLDLKRSSIYAYRDKIIKKLRTNTELGLER